MHEEEETTTKEVQQSRNVIFSYTLISLEGVRAPVMTIRTRRVAKSITKKRWTILSPESRTQAIAILRDIERYHDS
jgi:hypothetical protein